MTIKRLGLILLTLISLGLAGLSLVSSWQEPQFQSRLELYQTNIVLQAQAWQAEDSNDENLEVIQNAILGDKPLENATKQYQNARQSVITNLAKAKNQLAQLGSQPVTTPTPPKPLPQTQPANSDSSLVQEKKLQQSVDELQKLLAELDLRVGILQAQQGQTDTALKNWVDLPKRSDINPEFGETAAVLTGAVE